MKIFHNRPILTVLAATLIFGLVAPLAAFAATTPTLGNATSYGVLGSTYTNTAAGTTINGDVGFTTGPAVAPAGVHTNYGSGAPYPAAVTDQGGALSALAAQPCTFTFAPGAINLSTDATHGPAGIYTPGVYCSTGAMDVGGPLTLSGSGTYIFRPVGALTSDPGSVVTLAGASSCDVFWTPSAATTLAANTTFVGTDIDDSGITVGANTTWTGRSLGANGTVTTDTDTINVPTCTAPTATLHIVKQVVNTSGGVATPGSFNLHVKLAGTDVLGSPAVGTAAPGTPYTLNAATYAVSEDPNASYIATFSGDCDAAGNITLVGGDNKTCTVTNTDIAPIIPPLVIPTSGGGAIVSPILPPPLIDLVKIPNPLALPAGPGPVKYTYTVTNPGTVALSNITLLGDSCSPLTFVSGDTNSDSKLDPNETWVYTCTTTLTATHTNTVVATGWANGISATHIATATVVVGAPIIPPLIHVTKIPNPLVLPAGPGMVTYTEKITNPGTVALSNVTLTDDKCSPMKLISGDLNNNSLLEPNETWTYTCSAKITHTTTNTAVATGKANGFTVNDIAVATVVVGIPAPVVAPVPTPTFPNTGLPPLEKNTTGDMATPIALLFISISLVLVLRKHKI